MKTARPAPSCSGVRSISKLNARQAADIIWTLASERTYLALVRDRKWKAEDYERWLHEQLVVGLLERQPSHNRTATDQSQP